MDGIPRQGSLDLVCHARRGVWLDNPTPHIAVLYASQSILGYARAACRCLVRGSGCTDRPGGNLDLLAYGDCSALAREIILFPAYRPCHRIRSLIGAAPETWWIPCTCAAFINRRGSPRPKSRATNWQSGNNDGIQSRILQLRLRMTERSNSPKSDSEAYGVSTPRSSPSPR